jgi:hypothetical protein
MSEVLPGRLIGGGKGGWVKLGLGLLFFGGALWSCGMWYLLDMAGVRATLVVRFLLPLLWASLYFWRGWLKTFFGLWPAGKSAESMTGQQCKTCQMRGRPGRVYIHGVGTLGSLRQKSAFLCDECVRLRYRDTRVLIGYFCLLGGIFLISLAHPDLVPSRVEVPGVPVVVEYPSLSGSGVIMGLIGLAVIVGGAVIPLVPPSEKDMNKAGKAIVAAL